MQDFMYAGQIEIENSGKIRERNEANSAWRDLVSPANGSAYWIDTEFARDLIDAEGACGGIFLFPYDPTSASRALGMGLIPPGRIKEIYREAIAAGKITPNQIREIAKIARERSRGYFGEHGAGATEDLDLLPLTMRARNCLQAERIHSIAQLVRLSPGELLRIPNLGKITLAQIERALAERGLQLRPDA